jgi:hypothetical protein
MGKRWYILKKEVKINNLHQDLPITHFMFVSIVHVPDHHDLDPCRITHCVLVF